MSKRDMIAMVSPPANAQSTNLPHDVEKADLSRANTPLGKPTLASGGSQQYGQNHHSNILAQRLSKKSIFTKTCIAMIAGGLYFSVFCGHASYRRHLDYEAYIKQWLPDSQPTHQSSWMAALERVPLLSFLRHSHHDRKPPMMSPAEAEQIFVTIPSNDSARASSRSFTGQSHLAGTFGDWNSAVLVKKQWETMFGIPQSSDDQNVFEAGARDSKRMLHGSHCHHRRRFNEHGVRVWTDKYYSLLSFPLGKSSISLLSPEGQPIFNATLKEDAIPEDFTAINGSADNYPFHGGSHAGSAIGELVYANMGTEEDYQALERAGISLKGKIALVRYGGVFRGLKVFGAQKYGAVGIIIYSDPAEDGEVTEANGFKVYPDGPARQPSSVQRGSVQKLSFYPGDPLTPGKPAYKDANRIARDSRDINLPSIPSLPLSHRDALKLLEALNGKGKQMGSDWNGALEGVGYWTGPGPNVSMLNDVKENVTAIWNTYAMIPGHIQSETVLLGNHRDAWVFGAGDPNSGSASLNEIVKGFSVLLSKGWKPLRNILIASWDGEESGLIGSTEFVEDHEDWVVDNVVAYVNVDLSATGSRFDSQASPSMAHLMTNILNIVPSPDVPNKSILSVLVNTLNLSETSVLAKPTQIVSALGSGSDFSPFIQHAGIASSNLAFTCNQVTDPVYHYHSIYDSAYWMDKFGDPGFHRHVAAAQVLGLMVLRLADQLILPLNVTAYASTLAHDYLHQVKLLPGADQLDFHKLDQVTKQLEQSTQCIAETIQHIQHHFQHCVQDFVTEGQEEVCHTVSTRKVAKLVAKLNRKLSKFERQFIDSKGLPKRPWYRNLLVAPARYDGYLPTTLPGIIEALSLDHNQDEAQEQVNRLTKAIKRAGRSLKLHHVKCKH